MKNNSNTIMSGGAMKAIKRNLGILVALVALCVVLSFATSAFLTSKNIMNVLQQISTNGMIAFGMTYVIPVSYTHLDVYKRQLQAVLYGDSGQSSSGYPGRIPQA